MGQQNTKEEVIIAQSDASITHSVLYNNILLIVVAAMLVAVMGYLLWRGCRKRTVKWLQKKILVTLSSHNPTTDIV